MGYRIAVIFGGMSTEHEVSIVSALQVMSFLRDRHEVIPIYISKDGKWLYNKEFTEINTFKKFDQSLGNSYEVTLPIHSASKLQASIEVHLLPVRKKLFSQKIVLNFDVVFPVVHGLHGEDGTLQGFFDLLNIPYVGSGVLASAIGIDKVVTKQLLRINGIPSLEDYVVTRVMWERNQKEVLKIIESRFVFPVIVKPARLGSSIGVSIANDTEELITALSIASRFDSKIMVEPYLEDCVEVNCSVLGLDEPIVSTTEMPIKMKEFLSFKDKYIHESQNQGMDHAKRITPAPIPESQTKQIQTIALGVFKALECAGVVRVDFLIDQHSGNVYVNEINTMPGSISYYLWNKPPNNISPEQLVDKLIEFAFYSKQEKDRTKFVSEESLIKNIDLNLKKG